MTRTFSKAYGLGGLRVGYGYAPRAVIDVLNRIRGPFNLSGLALAGAEAAVQDRDWVAGCLRVNAAERARLAGGLRQLGIACDASHANFVLARFADEADAVAADAHLKAAGIIVRHPKGYGFPEALRITVGRPEDNARVLAALGSFRGAA
jgi:histidinol-phosphate aminotransferase